MKCSFQVGKIPLLGIYNLAFSAKLEAVGFDFPKQPWFPSGSNATCGAEVAHRHCQAGASALLSRLGFKPEVILLRVAFVALVS